MADKTMAFDPNEMDGDYSQSVKFPSDEAGMPTNDLDLAKMVGISHYARFPTLDSIGFNGMPVNSVTEYVNAFSKAITAPPAMQSYTRISYMPEQHNSGVIQWPGIPPESLRKVVKDNISPLMIIGMRVDDVLRYSGQSTHPWKPGWRIELRSSMSHPTDADKRDIKEAEQFILHCNIETQDAKKRDALGIQGFARFLASLVRDSLTFDLMAVWIDTDRLGRIKAFKALSGADIRFTGPHGFKEDKDKYAVGLDEAGNVIHSFTRDELVTYVRNPRPDPSIWGYGYPELEQGVRLIQGFTNALDLNVDTFNRNCYSEDTEVLTLDGWKSFGDVDISKDQFATLNMDNGHFEYQSATNYVWNDYTGDMYTVKSRCVDLLVTPEHRMIYEYNPEGINDDGHKYHVDTAVDFYGKVKLNAADYNFPSTSLWEGEEIFGTAGLSGDSYCLIAGSTVRHINDNELNGGGYPPIPKEIMGATKRQQELFLHGFCSNPVEKIRTKKLADQLQELFQKIGKNTSIEFCDGSYKMSIESDKQVCSDMEKTEYSGKIGCVTVPNGTLYVRRNGKAIWSGNSTPNGMMLLKGAFWQQRQLDVLAREWTNMKSGPTKKWAIPAIAVPKDGDITVLDLTNINGKEAYYQDFMNMVVGALCTLFRFPVNRLGYRISGKGPDTQPIQNTGPLINDEADPGLAPLLMHLETVINEYILWSRWPHLQLRFTGKNPKEDAREYEARSLAMTVDERRAASDLPPLQDEADGDVEKKLARIMGMSPTDPGLAGVFQAIASAMLGGMSAEKGPEAVIRHKKDPAASEDHGHMSGVRRDSAKESGGE